MFKLIGYLVVFVIGAGSGVWWGVNHPEQAQNLATIEQAKMNQYIALGKQQALEGVQKAQEAAPPTAPGSTKVANSVQQMLDQAKNEYNNAKKQVTGQ